MLERKQVIINVDETWLGMSDFRRCKWRSPCSGNSVAKLQISPRISMIVALDSGGEVFFSLVQANSNAKIMEIFFQHLAKRLDEDRPYWRKNTVILLDNAPYHHGAGMLKVFEKL